VPTTTEGPATGIAEAQVTAWFAEHVPDATAPLNFALVPGGRSNLTYAVTDAEDKVFVLRRPPVSHVLPTAHDMAREYRILSALGPSSVPVPATYGLCADPDVNGAPFYVMAFADGHILRNQASAEEAFTKSVRAGIGRHVASTLAALHTVDVDAIGLGDLGRRHGYLDRQLRRWGEQYRQTTTGSADGGIVEEVRATLAASVPQSDALSIVHGDYRLDNLVLDDTGQVVAVLDWEICTLGDPMADVGLLLVYWIDDGQPILGEASPTSADGFCSREELLSSYADASGRDVSDIAYYVAFGSWKLACILQGVYARYRAGAAAGDPSPVDEFPATVTRLAEQAAATLAAR
jgi:aminoglycoside phosphotransferase (APT) family kinase protein